MDGEVKQGQEPAVHHQAVMVRETLDYLACGPGQVVVDATVVS